MSDDENKKRQRQKYLQKKRDELIKEARVAAREIIVGQKMNKELALKKARRDERLTKDTKAKSQQNQLG